MLFSEATSAMGNCLPKKHALGQRINVHVHQEVNLTPHLHQSIQPNGADNRTPDCNQQSDPPRPTQTELDPYHKQFKKDPDSSLAD